MYFEPKYLKDIFTPEVKAELEAVVEEYHGPDKKFYFDDISDREVRRAKKLHKFNELLEPLAKEVFGDDTLRATYSILLTYNKDSHLVGHHDTNANIYTINYCVKSNVEWPIWFGDDDERVGLDIPEGEALAFMGCDDFHYREKTDQEDFFHAPKGLGQFLGTGMVGQHGTEHQCTQFRAQTHGLKPKAPFFHGARFVVFDEHIGLL